MNVFWSFGNGQVVFELYTFKNVCTLGPQALQYTVVHIQIYNVHIDAQLHCQWSLLFAVLIWSAFILLGMSVVGPLEKKEQPVGF